MQLNKLPTSELVKAGGVGIATALLLTGVMVPAMKFGFSPMPKPLGLAFAETVLGRALPLPVGLLFHIVYVAFWSIAFVNQCRDDLSLTKALILGGESIVLEFSVCERFGDSDTTQGIFNSRVNISNTISSRA